MLQARRLGKELIVGVHSDEDIMDNKGPTVMTLKERCVCFGRAALEKRRMYREADPDGEDCRR